MPCPASDFLPLLLLQGRRLCTSECLPIYVAYRSQENCLFPMHALGLYGITQCCEVNMQYGHAECCPAGQAAPTTLGELLCSSCHISSKKLKH